MTKLSTPPRGAPHPQTRAITSGTPCSQPLLSQPLAQPQALTRGPAFVEVVLPDGVLGTGTLPAVAGLTLKLWPQARLGDATLELHAQTPSSVPDMLARLDGAGITALGPVRVHH